MDPYTAITISTSITGASASVAAATAKIVVTKNKIRLTREALDGVDGPDRPKVLRALAELF